MNILTLPRIFKFMAALFVVMTAAVALALWLVPTSERGPAGPQGVPGVIGPVGETGDTGAKGVKGSTGDKGDTGEVGAKGAKGSGFWGATK